MHRRLFVELNYSSFLPYKSLHSKLGPSQKDIQRLEEIRSILPSLAVLPDRSTVNHTSLLHEVFPENGQEQKSRSKGNGKRIPDPSWISKEIIHHGHTEYCYQSMLQ